MAENTKSPEVLQAQRNPDQPSDTRCTRNDGKVWRCKKLRVEGNRFCESHVKTVNGGASKAPKKRHSTSDIAPPEKEISTNGKAGNGHSSQKIVKREEKVYIESSSDGDSDVSLAKQVTRGRRPKESKQWRATEKEENRNGRSRMCHQSQRIDKEHVIFCTNCDSKRYCAPCIKAWYPRLTEADVSKECPFCKGNCNCKACLRSSGPKRPVVEKSKAEKTKCFQYILAEILPILKQIEQEQNEELEIECKIQVFKTPTSSSKRKART